MGRDWLDAQRARGSRLVAVELGLDATPLPRVGAAVERTVILLRHEHHGVPVEIRDVVDETIAIPMTGRGVSLNVAVAGSLVLYRLAGLM